MECVNVSWSGLKERNKVGTASAYCPEQRRARLIVDGISVKTDKTVKESRGRATEKRKRRRSASEGITKKVKVDDAERRLAKPRQHMANTEPVKGRPTMYQQVISTIGKLNHQILPAQVTSLSF